MDYYDNSKYQKDSNERFYYNDNLEDILISINVDGFGHLSLPCVESQINNLIVNHSTTADYSEESFWEISVNKIKFNKSWSNTIDRIINQCKESLKLQKQYGKEIISRFERFLIFNEESYSSQLPPTATNENISIAQLFIILPSQHEGGRFIICLPNEDEITYNSVNSGEGTTIKFISFTSDCTYFIDKIEKGNMVCLEYTLYGSNCSSSINDEKETLSTKKNEDLDEKSRSFKFKKDESYNGNSITSEFNQTFEVNNNLDSDFNYFGKDYDDQNYENEYKDSKKEDSTSFNCNNSNGENNNESNKSIIIGNNNINHELNNSNINNRVNKNNNLDNSQININNNIDNNSNRNHNSSNKNRNTSKDNNKITKRNGKEKKRKLNSKDNSSENDSYVDKYQVSGVHSKVLNFDNKEKVLKKIRENRYKNFSSFSILNLIINSMRGSNDIDDEVAAAFIKQHKASLVPKLSINEHSYEVELEHNFRQVSKALPAMYRCYSNIIKDIEAAVEVIFFDFEENKFSSVNLSSKLDCLEIIENSFILSSNKNILKEKREKAKAIMENERKKDLELRLKTSFGNGELSSYWKPFYEHCCIINRIDGLNYQKEFFKLISNVHDIKSKLKDLQYIASFIAELTFNLKSKSIYFNIKEFIEIIYKEFISFFIKYFDNVKVVSFKLQSEIGLPSQLIDFIASQEEYHTDLTVEEGDRNHVENYLKENSNYLVFEDRLKNRKNRKPGYFIKKKVESFDELHYTTPSKYLEKKKQLSKFLQLNEILFSISPNEILSQIKKELENSIKISNIRSNDIKVYNVLDFVNLINQSQSHQQPNNKEESEIVVLSDDE